MKSKQSAARYPARWRMQILPSSIDIEITSNLPDQEMRTPGSTGVTYWEGSVSIDGTKNKLPVKGDGCVELTGYAADFAAAFTPMEYPGVNYRYWLGRFDEVFPGGTNTNLASLIEYPDGALTKNDLNGSGSVNIAGFGY